MATKPIPLVGWDPTNASGLVQWSCDCLSEANITAKGGTWTNNPAREFDSVKGVRVTAFTASSELSFDFRSQVTGEENYNLGYQLSFEIETSQVVGYLATNPYMNGVNAVPGNIALMAGWASPGVYNGMNINTRENAFGEVSAMNVIPMDDSDNDHKFIRSVSSYKKNFHTRLIMTCQANIWQFWAEHQDGDGRRIGLSCLTRSGFEFLAALDKGGMYFRQNRATPNYGFGTLTVFRTANGSTRTALNTYIRNIQLVVPAPTQTYHKVLRHISNTGDSYSSNLYYPSNTPRIAQDNSSVVGLASLGSDSAVLERAMARVVNDTGVNNYMTQECHFGGSTLINGWGPSRDAGGTANPRNAYLTNSFAVPAATVWSANMAVAVGDFIRPITRTGFIHVVTASDGLAGAVEPAFSVTLGASVTLDGVTYKCMDYDQDYTESGTVRKGFANPSLILHYGGFNDSDYIQRYENAGTAMYAGYSYATYRLLFEDLWRKWIKALLDQHTSRKILIFTVPASAPSLINVNGAPTTLGRQPALDYINTVYVAAPAYFHTLGAAYQGRVSTVDLKSMGGWNKIGDYSSEYSDGTHPDSERYKEILANAIYLGVTHMMRDAKNSVL